MKPERCRGCGLVVEEGTAGCHRIVEALWAREFRCSDPAYFRVHRMCIDTYCLQHPDRYCVSAKSFAAHLLGLYGAFEIADSSRAKFNENLRHWLNGTPSITKPQLPEFRGTLTIADVGEAADPVTYARAVEAWAKSIWEAYAPLHPLARIWVLPMLARNVLDATALAG